MEATTTATDPYAPALARLPAILGDCLDDLLGRYAPLFSVEGRVYATNGRIIAWADVPEGWDVPNPEGLKVIDVAPILAGEFRPDPIVLPEVEVRPCRMCGGAKDRAGRPCTECEAGEVDESCECPNCDGVHPCTNCDGKGTMPAGRCGHCFGTGVDGDGRRVEVAPGVTVAAPICLQDRFVALLRKHDARLFLPAGDPVGHPLKFTAGPVEGRVMPMSR